MSKLLGQSVAARLRRSGSQPRRSRGSGAGGAPEAATRGSEPRRAPRSNTRARSRIEGIAPSGDRLRTTGPARTRAGRREVRRRRHPSQTSRTLSCSSCVMARSDGVIDKFDNGPRAHAPPTRSGSTIASEPLRCEPVSTSTEGVALTSTQAALCNAGPLDRNPARVVTRRPIFFIRGRWLLVDDDQAKRSARGEHRRSTAGPQPVPPAPGKPALGPPVSPCAAESSRARSGQRDARAVHVASP